MRKVQPTPRHPPGMLKLPWSVTRVVGVMAPVRRPASEVISFHVEPGAYWPWMARLAKAAVRSSWGKRTAASAGLTPSASAGRSKDG